MHLLKIDSDGRLSRDTFLSRKNIPPYAILSHRWNDDEPNYQDITNGTGKEKEGYRKLIFCAEQAERDGIQYFWVDTVCIDKTSSPELQEAIVSMFQWYQDAKRCYAYLQDVRRPMRHDSYGVATFGGRHDAHASSQFDASQWFLRGWTLQELIAPAEVYFFFQDGYLLGTKSSLRIQIHLVTGIPISALQGQDLSTFSTEERMSWIRSRETTREEDGAYCLMGIFDVSMPVIYGERESKAFRRLKVAIAEENAYASGTANRQNRM